ncbi:MAG: hypothetical protein EOP48_03225 [Sphingobacteriales bacterium]|nr:MAG: hypothetical protein EOP48_03225 [Sphingobacteriales bacterium]
MKWEKKTVEDLVVLQRGYDLPESDRKPGEIPIIGSAGLTGFHNEAKVQGPCVTMGRSGNSIGKITFVKEDFWPHNACLYVKDFKKNDIRFSYYLLKTLDLKGLNSGGAIPSLNRNLVYPTPIVIPPLPTQRKIASILSAYDDLIENNLKRIKLLEEKAAIAYKTEFGNYQVSNKVFASLPKGWSVKTIGDIYGKLESGSRPKGGIDKELKEGVASVGAENVIGLGKYNYQSEKLITLAFFQNMNRGIIEDKDILIYKDGAYIGKTTLFQDGFPHEKCCVNEHVFLLTSKDVRYQYFLFFTLNQGLYFEKMQQLDALNPKPLNDELTTNDRMWLTELEKLVRSCIGDSTIGLSRVKVA